MIMAPHDAVALSEMRHAERRLPATNGISASAAEHDSRHARLLVGTHSRISAADTDFRAAIIDSSTFDDSKPISK